MPSNGHPYRDSGALIKASTNVQKGDLFTMLLGSLRDENDDRWPQAGKEGQGRIRFLSGSPQPPKSASFRDNSLIAYRRTWLKIIAWAAAEGLVLETFPVERVGSSMRRRPAAERLASPPGQSCARSPLSRSGHQIPSPGVLRQSSPPRKLNAKVRNFRLVSLIGRMLKSLACQ